MIRIVGIVGSPRVGGNTEKLVADALETARKEGVETELVRLAQKEIKPCDACLSCKKTGECHIKDDFNPIFEKMIESDGMILSSPVYFGSATPQMKALIDRAGYVAIARNRILENKVGGPLVVARRAGQNFTLAQILFFFLIQGMIVPGSTYWNIAFGRNIGEVRKDKEGLTTAQNFAKKMVWVIKKLKDIPE